MNRLQNIIPLLKKKKSKCIEDFNSEHVHKSNLEVNSVKDMIRNLESYKL